MNAAALQMSWSEYRSLLTGSTANGLLPKPSISSAKDSGATGPVRFVQGRVRVVQPHPGHTSGLCERVSFVSEQT